MRVIRFFLLFVFAFVPFASAQTPATTVADDVPFSRVGFTFGWSALTSTDPRFDWRASIGLDVDLVDYQTGRVTFAADYEGTLGGERRTFDLNQGAYSFDAGVLQRVGHGVEVGGFVSHLSRHVVDRENPVSVSSNLMGGRLAFHAENGLNHVNGHVEGGFFVQQAFVDYRATLRGRVAFAHGISARTDAFVAGRGEVIWVDPEIAERGTLVGVRAEAGVRVNGQAAAIELFAAYDDRIDAYPIDRERRRWIEFGARIVGR